MTNTVFPDGFPTTPLEAINYSYFLSDQDKVEWREWLNDASGEQQGDLVEILHSMWQENQKAAIPQGFSTGNPQQAQGRNDAVRPQQVNQNQAVPIQNPIQNPSINPAQQPQPVTSHTNQFAQMGGLNQIPVQSQVQSQPQPSPQPQQQNLQPQNTSHTNQFAQMGGLNANPAQVQLQPQPNTSHANQFAQMGGLNTNPAQVQLQPQLQPQPQLMQNPNQSQNSSHTNQFAQMGGLNTNQIQDQNPVSNLPNQIQNSDQNSNSNTPLPIDIAQNEQPQIPSEQQPEKQANLEPARNINNNQNRLNNNEKTIERANERTSERTNDGRNDRRNGQGNGQINNQGNGRSNNNGNQSNGQQNSQQYAQKPQLTRAESNLEENKSKIEEKPTISTQSIVDIQREYLRLHQQEQSKFQDFIKKTAHLLDSLDSMNLNSGNVVDGLLDANNKISLHARKIQALENATQNRGSSLQDQIDDIRYDLDKLIKDFKDLRGDTRKRYDEISQQMAAMQAGVRAGEGQF